MNRLVTYCTLLLTITLLFTSCDVPYDVLNQDDMAAVLTDIHLTEALVGQQYSYNDYGTKRACFESVFKKHGITRDDFNRSLEWYAHHPKVFAEVYTVTVAQLGQKRADVEAYLYHPEENPELRHVIDSVNVWTRPQRLRVDSCCYDSLHFELTDSVLLCGSERYLWQFQQRIEHRDATVPAFLQWYVVYADGTCDSIVYRLADSVATYAYKVPYRVRNTAPIQRVYGTFCTVADSAWCVAIDSVRLWRYYNRETHPLDSAVLLKLDSLRGESLVTPAPDTVAAVPSVATAPRTIDRKTDNKETPSSDIMRKRLMQMKLHETNSGK
ncbi:MAG: DUF4296 domain-containing protein [Paludibacteraceae bacterium]